MVKEAETLDWSLWQAFLAVAETGSLSAAARRLQQSQPTLGRQIRKLEDNTGLDLFARQPRGLDLTDHGRALLPAARRMAEASGQIALAMAGEERGLTGTLRITASEIVAYHHLPPILARMRAEAPEMTVVLLPTDSSENLLFREADIAIRMYRSDQLDIVTRQIGTLSIGAFAARNYLERRGMPTTPEEIMEHDLIGFDRADLILRGMRQMGLTVDRDSFALRCDDQVTYWELVRAGNGIGFGQHAVAAKCPEVVELFPNLPIPPLPVWLAAHEAMRRTPRVALAWRILEEELAPILGPVARG
ncbi:LysR family transcriptional regulator [Pseudooceanicola sp.]